MAKDQHGWYSPEEKMHYIEEYFNSGLSLTKFCDSRDICRSTISTWIRHYNSANLIAKNTFQDVTPIFKQEPQSINSSIKLTLPNGISLEFDSSILHLVIGEFKW